MGVGFRIPGPQSSSLKSPCLVEVSYGHMPPVVKHREREGWLKRILKLILGYMVALNLNPKP